MFFIRLYRLIPMLVVLVITALIIYFISSLRATKPKAKSNVLLFFTWAFIVTTVVFALATGYALIEQNTQVTELMGSFALACLIFLGITRICYRVFVSHYPNYAWKPTRSRIVPWFEQVFKSVRSRVRGQRPEPPVNVEGTAKAPSEDASKAQKAAKDASAASSAKDAKDAKDAKAAKGDAK